MRWLMLLGCCLLLAAAAASDVTVLKHKVTGTPVVFNSAFMSHCSGGSCVNPFGFVSTSGYLVGSVGVNANRVLIAHVGHDFAITGLAVTWGGTAMTFIGVSGTTNKTHLFGLINPATGAQTLQVSFTGTPNTIILGAVSLYNADQTTGWSNFIGATGTSTAPAVTVTTATNTMAVAGHANNNATSTAANVGTSAYAETCCEGNYALSYRANAAGSTALSWTLGSSVLWAVSGVNVLPF